MLAVACGDHLLQKAERREPGLAWKNPRFPYLGGFSHGTAGIAWALLRLARVSGERRFEDAGLAALAYDRSLYVPEDRTWRDLRQEKGTVISAWCHGSAGIGLSRLLMGEVLEDPRLREECGLAAEHLAHAGFGVSHCLCHGDLGNLELLAALGRQAGREDHAARVDAHLAHLVARAREGAAWKSGMPGRNVDIFGLFMGLAGMGMGLLRFAAWERVPSVLALEGPSLDFSSLHR